MKTVYAFILFAFFNIATNTAQFVSIPDANFRSYLMQQYPTCFNANQEMDTTCNEVVNEDIMACEGVGISDLTGVQYFINVYDLNCNVNTLTELPILPPNLQTLWCANNSITKLTNLPASLLYLDCSANQIDTISNLPNNLLELDARLNYALINIQTLPNSLQLLDVSQGDNLIDISAISNSSLKKFYCDYNSIALMPSLPANLEKLSCSGNQLTALPALPSTLDFLACSSNNLSSLPNLPNNLLQLRCNNNLITILPNLSNGILELKCSNNLLDSLPFLPNSLIELICDNNSIEFLPLLPLNLYWLDCSSNDISNLPTLPPNLEQLYCSGNLLTSIPNLPSTIYTLKCASNNLYSLPSIPPGIDMIDILGNPNLHCLPQLPAMSIFWFNPANFTCMPNYANIPITSDPLTSFPLCDVFNTYGCTPYWNISGKTYVDSNSNCLQDNTEAGFQHIKMKLFENGNLLQQTLTNQAGQFSFNTNLGVYDIAVDTTNLPFSVSCPLSNLLQTSVTPADSMHYNKDFALNCKPGFDIGATTVVQDSGRFKPGNFVKVKAYLGDISNLYGMNCASGVSGQVVITINGPTVFAGVPNNALMPSVQNNVLTYTIADFGALDFYHDFQFRCLTDTNASIGSAVCFDLLVTPLNGDNNGSNNNLNYCFNIVNSYDPNDKLVYPIGNILPSQEYLTYTVNFQNTGNAPADHIYIMDTISNYLDIESFEVLATSHNMQLQITNNIVRFNFANINLPDSNSNEPASHGYVQYRIKLKNTVVIGDSINNTAFIFFDFNAAIVTNTTVSEVSLLTTVKENLALDTSIVVYPNPANDVLFIQYGAATKESFGPIAIYNSIGAHVLSFSNQHTESVDIAGLPDGLYFLDIGNKRFKFVKQ
jgi:Leucine-rich repeat (LRR) protein